MEDRYAHNVSLDTEDSYSKIVRRTSKNSTVLDIGTGPGGLGKFLQEEIGCITDGIELDPDYCSKAAPFYRKIWNANLENMDLLQVLGDRKYSHIICADVLEHLRNPEHVLKVLPNFLEPNGNILISIPNISYAGFIAEILVAGEFEYRDNGILDQTHVRFFTRNALIKMLSELELQITHFDTVNVEFSDSEFGFDWLSALPGEVFRALVDRRDAHTYQFIVEAVKGPTTGNEAFLDRKEIDWSKGLIADYEKRLRSLESRSENEITHLKSIVAEQQRELEHHRAELEKKREQVAALRQEVQTLSHH
jgi:O-antigen biosynthesis protein